MEHERPGLMTYDKIPGEKVEGGEYKEKYIVDGGRKKRGP